MRKNRGWLQEALAERAETTRVFISHLKRGTKNITLDTIGRIARALGCDIHELLVPPRKS